MSEHRQPQHGAPITPLYIHSPKNTSSTSSPIQCSCHSRDATVSPISVETNKPFNPYCSWRVPKFHSDTTSFTCR
uniref:Uncharacterized protein n=1 Tax=Salix viminalis TaxID=40686 RepID=A0A6N2KN02_SALVM